MRSRTRQRLQNGQRLMELTQRMVQQQSRLVVGDGSVEVQTTAIPCDEIPTEAVELRQGHERLVLTLVPSLLPADVSPAVAAGPEPGLQLRPLVVPAEP